ncbi:MAG: tetratricopeptide repeat protein [Candidatus Acidiferrales bacterium]
MKYSLLPVAFLSLIFAVPSHAQRLSSVALRQVTAVQPASQPEMTPRQLAELRADIFMARKMFPEAIQSYQRLIKEEPHNAVLLNKLGIAYEGIRNDGPAERAYKRAIKADKTYASAYNNVGTVEYDRHKYTHAIEWYQKTLALRPDMAAVYYNLGCAYFDAKEYPEAMDAFVRAIQIDPHVMTANGGNGSVVQPRGTSNQGLFYFYIARTYAQLGNVERCAHYLKMARDVGYDKFVDAKTDPAFAKVIADPQVRAVFVPVPELATSKPH